MTSPISSKVALNLVKMIFLCLAYSASYAAEENAWLDNNLDDFLKSNPSVPAIAIVMVQHGKAIMSGSKGVSSDETGNAFTIDTPVRIASVTKLYVAAVIFRLIEENKVTMEDSIADLISSSHAAVLDESGYDLQSIKVKHLLSHTSGLRDYATSELFLNQVLENPHRHWSALEQIGLVKSLGAPVNNAGVEMLYSDTGYLLLAHVIEQITEEPLYTAVRDYLNFHQLGLERTWWELGETKSFGFRRADQIFLQRNTQDWHPSLDSFGGGGMVSSTAEMAQFADHLFGGSVFQQNESILAMTSEVGLPENSGERHGFQVMRFGTHQAFGHNGFWGTTVWHIPDLKLTVAGTVTSTSGLSNLLELVVEVTAYFETNRLASDNTDG